MAGAAQEPEPEAPLPAIYHQMPTILGYLANHQVVVVSASPGSGKSSVLPRYLATNGYGPVVCAQPRHFAATVAAARAGEEWERDVVFTTTRRLVDVFGARSPVLASFGAVVIDEAHERTLSTDVLLGMAKASVETGSMGHCRVVICTAGGPADDMLFEFFGAPIVACLRTAHPVEVHYSIGPMLDMVGAVVDEVAAIHASQPPGDVLAFLPENVNIEQAKARLKQLDLPGLVTRYIHDHLPAELTDTMLNAPVPDGSRRVVLATDVAETAVLVRGITYVVDPGLISEEPLERISKETATRRAAMAGFAGPGSCHRLYLEKEHPGLDEHTVPHIRRDSALAKFVLMLKRHAAVGMPGFEVFDPAVEPAVLENVADQLVAAGYLDKHGNLTDKGEREAYDED